MATMNISLPGQMRDWVETRIGTGLYSNNSDYVRDLIRRDQMLAQRREALQLAISEGLESGDAGELDMSAIKKRARQAAGLNQA